MCPTCKRKVAISAQANPYKPFCSERCRLVDLGAWLDGAHRISAPISEEDMDEGMPGLPGDGDDTSGPN
jgi:uncharacterized protein